MKREDRARLGGLGTNWKRVFYEKLTHMTTPKILSVSPLTTKEHPYKVKKICEAVFINYEKTALQIFYLLSEYWCKKKIKFAHLWYTPLERLQNCSKPPINIRKTEHWSEGVVKWADPRPWVCQLNYCCELLTLNTVVVFFFFLAL